MSARPSHRPPKKSDQKARTREAILASASRLLRVRGIAGTNVADVMQAAGLTVGGFYAHFDSKEALIEASLHRCLGEWRGKLLGRPHDEAWPVLLEGMLERYLSARHRDEPSGGCPLPAVAAEIALEGMGKHALAAELAAFTEWLQKGCHAEGERAPRSAVLGSLALMLGGLVLARALRDTPMSEEFLRACRCYGRAALKEMGETQEPAVRSWRS